MTSFFRWAFVALVSFFSLFACSGAQPEKDLPYRVEVFNEHLRWGRFDRAAEFVVPMRRAAFIQEREEQAEEVRLSDYEIISVRRESPTTAKVRVSLMWNRLDSTIIKKSVLEETWTKAGSTWFLVSMKTQAPKKPKSRRRNN
jgi:hypothetical protein